MKAVQINSYGGSEVITINNNALKPVPARGQVLVEVSAAGLNPVDKGVSAGFGKDMVHLSFPITLGGDFAGVIVQVGEGVSGFKLSDKVYGQALCLNGGSGSLAPFVAANVSNSAIMPKHLNFVEAASLPLAGVSALQALEENIKLKSGQKILIHGGAGGIGSLAIQIAKYLGAYVATTASTDNKDFVKKLGADLVIDFKKEDFEKSISGYDAVLDLVGGETTNKSYSVLKKGGILVTLIGKPDPESDKKYQVKSLVMMTNTNTKNLNRLTELLDIGKIKPQIDKVFTLSQAIEAFKHLSEGHPRGKVVVRIND
jgi:NADPH:quinone reductase-like Zn-dependent oxidoreductase